MSQTIKVSKDSVTVSVGSKRPVTIKSTKPANIIKITHTGPPGPAGTDGEGLPIGGNTGQVLTKDSNIDFDYSWQNQAGITVTEDFIIAMAVSL